MSTPISCPSCGAENDPHASSCGQCARDLYALTNGTILSGRYEILEAAGRGGMGLVYKARDRELEETVAVKVLRGEKIAGEDTAGRFRAEIKLARKVRHPNVCAIHEYGQHGHLRFIAMEYVEGVDLRRVLRERGAFPPEEAYDVAIQIADGLQGIHDVGVIHRDLKPPNIMRDPRGLVRLMDFGIAKRLEAESAGPATITGQILGTPEYMSPEQAQGEKVDGRSDIYALGVVMFEMFTGELPFKADTPLATLMQHINTPPPLEGPRARRIPLPLIGVLKKALAKKRDDRFGTAGELAAALRKARAASFPELATKPVPGAALAQGEGRPRRSPVPREAPKPGSPSVAAPATDRSSLAGILIGAVIALLVVAAASAWLLFSSLSAKRATGGALREPSATTSLVPTPEAAVSAVPAPTPEPAIAANQSQASPEPTTKRNAAPTPQPRPSSPPPVTARPVIVRETTAAPAPTLAVAPTASPSPVATGPATLVITSSAPGTLTIDGDPRGRTPLTISLEAGTHSVVLSSDDGRMIQEQVTLAAGERVERVLRFPGFGGLSVTSTVWVNVSVDDGPARATPTRFDRLPVGRHVLRAFREGYDEQRIEVEIREGEVTRLNVELKQR